MKFKVGDRVVRLNNGRNKGGNQGDDFNAYVGLVAEVVDDGSNWTNCSDGRIGVRYAQWKEGISVWFPENCIHERIYNSKLYKVLN